MAINKIISEKTLNYIETLYLYTNLQDFLPRDPDYIYNIRCNYLVDDIKDVHLLESESSDLYRDMLGYVNDTMLSDAEYMGTSHGRMWYKFENYRLGIMDYSLSKRSNQFNIEIQYTQAHLFSLDKELKGLDLPFEGSLEDYRIKRIDVTQIVKTHQDYLTGHSFISPYRTVDRFSKSGRTETIYLGHRKSGNVFRMYNKTTELKVDTKEKPMNYKKIDLFSKYFGDVEDLYTFELEMHRKYLKPTFAIDTLADIQKVYKAHRDIVGKIRIYEDNDQNRKLIAQNHRDRVPSLCLVEYEELKRVEKRRYKTSKSYMIDKVVTAYNRYEESCENPIGTEGRLSIVSEICSKIVDTKDITISIEDSAYTKSIIDMRERHENMRDNQDDQLHKEAVKTFSPLMTQDPTELF